jgi:hypothetical protein
MAVLVRDEKTPVVFISYAHEDKEVARSISSGLQHRGCQVWFDEGELRIGDSIIERIATALAEVDFVVAIVSPASVDSPWCQKELALAMTGGLSREHVRVLPLRLGDVTMPPALLDQLYLQIERSRVNDILDKLHQDVLLHLKDRNRSDKEKSNPMKVRASSAGEPQGGLARAGDAIRITGIVKEGVGEPRDDGTRGSALYRVPLRLSRRPSPEWSRLFRETWDHPPRYSTMHRPGIASVVGDTIVLDGTTIDELESVHLQTLHLVLERVNAEATKYEEHQRRVADAKLAAQEKHQAHVDEVAKRLHPE